MGSGVFLPLILFPFYAFTISALPSSPRDLGSATRTTTNITISESIVATPEPEPEPYPAYPVHCINVLHAPRVIPADCGHVLNHNLLEQPNVFKKRPFFNRSYKTDAGGYALARWWHDTCEVSVEGHGTDTVMLSFFDVALTANKVVYECIDGVKNPQGGLSLIGGPDRVYVLTLHALTRLNGVPPPTEVFNNNNTSHHQPPALSISKRAMIGSRSGPGESANGVPHKVEETGDLTTGASDLPLAVESGSSGIVK